MADLQLKQFLSGLQQQGVSDTSNVLMNSPSPDAMMTALEAEKRTGLPPSIGAFEPDMARSQVDQHKMTEALSSAPKTGYWLRDTVNASLAKDDLENLSWWESFLQAPSRGMERFAEDAEQTQFGKGVATGITGAKQMATAAATIPVSGMTKTLLDRLDVYKRTEDLEPGMDRIALANALGIDPQSQNLSLAMDFLNGDADRRQWHIDRAAQVLSSNEELMGFLVDQVNAYSQEMQKTQGATQNFTDIESISSFGDWLAFNTGQGIPYLAAVFAASAAGGAPAAMGVGYGIGVGDIQAGLIEEGITDHGGIALVGAIPYAALEYLGPAAAPFRNVSKATLARVAQGYFKRLGREVPKQAIEEFINEAGQEVIKDYSVAAGGGKPVELTDETLLRWFNAGMAGTASAVSVSPITATISDGGLEREVGRAGEAIGQQSYFDQIDKMAADSMLRQRSPEKFAEVLNAQGAADQALYVSPDAVQEYFQAKDMALDDETLRAWGIEPDAFNDGLASGDKVAIPLATYAAHLSGTDDGAWIRQNSSFSPDGMTSAEASSFNESVREIMDDAYAEAERQRLADEEVRSSDVQVYDQVFSQLREAGRMPDAADHEARVMTAFMRTMGERYGEDALDLYRRFGLQIRGPMTEEAVGRRRGQVDVMLNTLRSRGDKALKPRGSSLLEFIRANGGIRDTGGDVASFDVPKGVIAETREQGLARQSQPTMAGMMPSQGKGLGLDEMGRMAIEAGYFPEYMGGADTNADGTVVDEAAILLDAIQREVSGEKFFVQGEGPDPVLSDLADQISRAGIDISKMSNGEVIAALEASQNGEMYNQSGSLNTDSQAFKDWFGGSKVVDENGNPLVVYHGGTFDAARDGAFSSGKWFGFFFSPDKKLAQSYAPGMGVDVPVTPAFLSLQNPFNPKDPSHIRAQWVQDWIDYWRQEDGWIDRKTGEEMTDEDVILAIEDTRLYEYDATGSRERWDDFLRTAQDYHDGFYGYDPTDGGIIAVAFEPTQIKSVFNQGTFDRNNPNILFQDTIPDQPLYVVHNLSAGNLRFASDLGGLAAPSIAIARGDIGFDSFGEISLIGDPSMADPKAKGVRAFTADVYSPRQPRARFKVNARAVTKLNEAIKPVADMLGVDSYIDESEIARGGMGAIDSQMAVKAAWLRSQGEDIPIVREAPDEPMPVAGFTGFTSTDVQALASDPAFLARVQRKYELAVKKNEGNDDLIARINAAWLDESGQVSADMIAKWAGQVARANQAIKDFRAAPQAEGKVSRYLTGVKIDEAIAGREDQFNTWLRENFGDVIGDAYFEDERGRRRDYTLTHLVREMTRSIRNGENWNYGAGNVRAAVAPEFRTLSEVKAARGQITDEKAMEALKDEVNTELFSLADKFAPYAGTEGKQFGWGDIFSEFLRDVAKGPRAVAEWPWSSTVPGELMSEAGAFLEKLKGLPTNYFEIKMQRAVSLKEFTAAIVPHSLDADARKILTDAGLELVEYDPSVDGSRQQAMQEIGPRVFFQSQQDRGGRGVGVQRNGDVELTALKIKESSASRSEARTSALDRRGHFKTADGTEIEITRSGAKKITSGVIMPIKAAIAEYLPDLVQSSVIYGENDGALYAASVVEVDGVKYATRLVFKPVNGALQLYHIEGFKAAPAAQILPGNQDTPALRPATASSMNVTDAVRVFNENNGAIAPHFQDSGQKRGSIQFPSGGIGNGQTVINLFEANDLSTFLHESGHFFLEAFKTLATDPNAPQQMRDDLAAIYKWMGVKGWSEVKVEHHEKWARGFEAYALEGKAPSIELASSFARFKAWLTRIYKTALGLKVKISPEIRSVMDRMLATDAEIAQARADMEMRPLFKDGAPEGMAKSDWEAYQRLAKRTTEAAEQTLLERTMAKVRREREAWFRTEKKAVQAEVLSSLQTQARYRLIEVMANQGAFGKEGVEVPNMRIDRQALVDAFGEGILAELSRSRLGGKRAIYAEGGVSLREAASFFGFSDPAAMIDELQNTVPLKNAVKAEVERILDERYGDPLNDGSIEEEALKAIHNEEQGRVLAAEARTLAKRAGASPRTITSRLFKARAAAMLGRMNVREASKSGRFLAAERRAAKDAEKAFAKVVKGGHGAEQALAEARQAKEQQLLNHHLYNLSKVFEADLAKVREKMRSYAKQSVREKLAGGYIEQIDDLLDRFDFRKRSEKAINRSEKLSEYIDRMTAEGREAELNIDGRLLDEARRVNYTRMTVDELRGLVDTIANIDHMGRFKQKLIEKGRTRDLLKTVERVRDTLIENNKIKGDESSATPVLDLIRRPDTILAMLEGGEDFGVLHTEIKLGIDRGIQMQREMRDEMTTKYSDIFKAHYTEDEIRAFDKEVFASGVPAGWTRGEVLALAHNIGNESSFQRVMDQSVSKDRRLTPQMLDALLGTLDERDWRFVQDRLNLFDHYWTQFSEVQKRRTGVEPKKIEAKVMWPNAPEFFTGGYYPAKYDPQRSVKAVKDEASVFDRNQNLMHRGAAKVNAGMAIERKQTAGGRTLLYDLNVQYRAHVDEIRVIALSEAVDNAGRILRHPEVMQAFLDIGRQSTLKTLNLWLDDVAHGQTFSGKLNLARELRNNFITAKLGFNFMTAVKQTTGMIQTAAVIGVKYSAKGFAAYVKHPIDMVRDVTAKSAVMKERQSVNQRDLMDLLEGLGETGMVTGATKKSKRFLGKYGSWLTNAAQFYTVDMPTWISLYKHALDSGMSDGAAIERADLMLKRIHDGADFMDRAGVERGTTNDGTRQNHFIKLFTTLGGYLLLKSNRAQITVAQAAKTIRSDASGSAKMAAAFDATSKLILAYSGEAALVGLIEAMLRGDGEDDDKELLLYILSETGLNIIGGIPFGRDLASAATGHGSGGTYGSILSDYANVYQQAAQGEADVAALKAVITALGTTTGFPSTETNRIISVLADPDKHPPAEILFGRTPMNR